MSQWSDINKKLINYKTERVSDLKPYIDYDPNDLNDPNNPENPNFRPKTRVDIVDENIQAVKNSLNNIFSTKIGELPGEPEFGNNFSRWLFQQMDSILVNSIQTDIVLTLQRWEPRVEILGIEVNMNPDYNEVLIDVKFKIKMDATGQVFTHRVAYDIPN